MSLLERFCSLGQPPKAHQKATVTQPGIDRGGVESHAFLELGHRSARRTLRSQCHGKIHVQLGPIIGGLDTSFVGGDGIVETPQRIQAKALKVEEASGELPTCTLHLEHGQNTVGPSVLEGRRERFQEFLELPRTGQFFLGPCFSRRNEKEQHRDPFDPGSPGPVDWFRRATNSGTRFAARGLGSPPSRRPDPVPSDETRAKLRNCCVVLLWVLLWVPTVAHTELLFDFEGPYLVDPGRSIKDHEMLFDGQLWHCIYIRGTEGANGTGSESTLGHATSIDLLQWQLEYPVLSAGPESWDSRNVWAPAIIQTPINPSQWTMLYTGADASIVQRMGRAFTTNGTLDRFYKFPTNPVLEPDSTVYDWAASQWFSSFRDPYYFYFGGEHHVLNTVGLDGAKRRGAVHHATSADLINWTDVGVLVQNNNDTLGTQWHDLESVQLIQHAGQWFLFFTEQNEVGVRWIQSTQMDSGWNVSSAQILDPEGIAAEVTPLDGESFLFSRHIPFLHSPDSPDSGTISWTIRADTLRYHPVSGAPYLVPTAPLASNWPVRSGTAFIAAPTFGDNALERGGTSALANGHGYLSSRDFYAGPASGFGQPGSDMGGSATGTMQSIAFDITPGSVTMSLRVGGGSNLNCFVALVRADNDSVLYSARGHGSDSMRPVVWDVSDLNGVSTYIWIEDASTDSNGWISVDDIRLNPSAVASPSLPSEFGRLLPNRPNPFNPRTALRFEVDRRESFELRIFDLRGRLLRRLELGPLSPGRHQAMWEGRDQSGRQVSSGVYLVELRGDLGPADTQKITLVR
jgi:Glycosyl hydrolases family 32 N-terminal domain/FlgD Ig-like domain